MVRKAAAIGCVAISICISGIAWQCRAQTVSQTFSPRTIVPYTDSDKSDPEKNKWVAECMAKMGTIRPGMTRADLMKVFTRQGGFVVGPNLTFEYQGCRYFKVDVKFRHPAHDEQGRVIEKDTDVIESVSTPYLGEVHYR